MRVQLVNCYVRDMASATMQAVQDGTNASKEFATDPINVPPLPLHPPTTANTHQPWFTGSAPIFDFMAEKLWHIVSGYDVFATVVCLATITFVHATAITNDGTCPCRAFQLPYLTTVQVHLETEGMDWQATYTAGDFASGGYAA